MIKKFISVLTLFGLTLIFTSCNTSELFEYKVGAKKELEIYIQNKDQTNYSDENWTLILEVVEDGKTDIDIADDKTKVDAIVADAKNTINAVPREGLDKLLNDETKEESGEFMKTTFIEAIDPLSSIMFDSKNPVGGTVIFGMHSSYLYVLNGVEIYEFLLQFEKIQIIPNTEIEELDYLEKKISSIIINVDYKYIIDKLENPKSLTSVEFLICEDGTLFFKNARGNIYYSEAGSVDYINLVNHLKTN